MRLSFLKALLCAASLAFASPLEERQACSSQQRIAAVQSEIRTIRSHSAADAARIPLAPLASRTFFITPAEANAVAIPANVGLTANTVRGLLVILATVLDADVPQGSDTYTVNNNNTVTVDFIQTNRIALPEVQVREIHSFNPATCQITRIVGFVNGPLSSFTGGIDLAGTLQSLQAGQAVGDILDGLLG